MMTGTDKTHARNPRHLQIIHLLFAALALFQVIRMIQMSSLLDILRTGDVIDVVWDRRASGMIVMVTSPDAAAKGVRLGDLVVNAFDSKGPVGSQVTLLFQTGSQPPRPVTFVRQPGNWPVYMLVSWGVSLDAAVLLALLPKMTWFVACLLAAAVLIWRRAHDWMTLLVTWTLVAAGSSTSLGSGAYDAITNVLYVTVLLLFPTGRFKPRWSWILVVLVGLFSVLMEQWFAGIAPYWIHPIPLNLLMVLTLAAGVLIAIHRYQRVFSLVERQQAKWVLLGFSGLPIVALFFGIIQLASGAGFFYEAIPSFAFSDLILFPATTLLIPVGILFATLRIRLWDVDYFISRTLVFALMSMLLFGLFTALTFGISLVSQDFAGGPVLAVGITGLVSGIAFQPARRRLQRMVDSRIYQIHIDYHGARLRSSTPAGYTGVIRTTGFGAYRNLELLGRGGMAEVYRAVHPSLGITVAIKLLSTSLAEDPGFQHRFLREAKVASRMHHPNIVRVFDYGEMEGTYYMIMEYLAGQDLGKKLAQEGRMSLRATLPILSQIASALDYAHTQGLVHRDIKPSNIMIEECEPGENGATRAVLTDFGIAKILTSHTALTGTGMLGTLDYISPEQIQAQADLGASADIYSFGIMAYRMLCGVLPFQQQNPGALLIAHLTQPPVPPREYVPDLPAAAQAAILRALEKNPANRFPSAGEFVKALGG